MSRYLTLAALQAPFDADMESNIASVDAMVREAAGQGADVALPPELFCGPYFCKTQDEEHFASALPWQTHPAV
ncbi:MAG: nitrilase-related carbon-nitrogen hydrolase, partial [Pseudomonadota bacterium]